MQNYQPNNKHSVAVAIIEKNDKVLIALRTAEQDRPTKWAFPMGKVETGETLTSCLKRELQEELGIVAQIGDYVGTTNFCSNHKEYELHAFKVHEFSGKIILNDENTEFVWIATSELENYDMLEIQMPFVKTIQDLA